MKKTKILKGAEESKTIVAELESAIKDFSRKVDGFVYPLIIPPLQSIDEDILFEIYPDLCSIGKRPRLHVLLYSYGGDAHTAFHIGRLLQDYSEKELLIYVLREAKSAATLISCAADKIILSEISELGPMDPQIKHKNLDRRFSPLAIKHIFDFLQQETDRGHTQIVSVLAEKLPDPLIIGEHLKSLETGKEYLQKLMTTRMFKDQQATDIKAIAEKLVTGYPDHGYCIDYTEAKSIGLSVEKISPELAHPLFHIMQSYKKVWDLMQGYIQNLRSDEGVAGAASDSAAEEASKLYLDLKKLAKNVIDFQKETESSLSKEVIVRRRKTRS